MAVAPEREALSLTRSPIAPLDSDSLVEIDGPFGLTVRVSDSQALVAPWLLASPLYTACQYQVPALLKVMGLESGTMPADTVMVPASIAPAEQVLFV